MWTNEPISCQMNNKYDHWQTLVNMKEKSTIEKDFKGYIFIG